jgi:hypothetical protein
MLFSFKKGTSINPDKIESLNVSQLLGPKRRDLKILD